MTNAKTEKTERAFEEALKGATPLICKISLESSIPGMGVEDIRQELSLHLWLCWQKWDPTRDVKFLTYAYPALHQRRDMMYRRARAKLRGCGQEPISYEAESRSSVKEDKRGLIEFLADDTQDLDAYIERQEVKAAIDAAIRAVNNDRVRGIVMDLIDGFSQVEVSKKYECAQSLVSYHYDKFRRILAAELLSRGLSHPSGF